MPANAPHLTPSDLRSLRRNIAQVSDAQMLQVVALVDRMAERGSADDLIAPLRARFGRVRPPRPLRFTRLLFLPLDPVLIPAPRYRAGMAAVPRSAVIPLGAVVRDAMGPHARVIEADTAGHTVSDIDAVQQAGARLWPMAGAILRTAPPPSGWVTAGLPASLYEPLARNVATVLEQASDLQAVVAEAATGLPVDLGVTDRFLAQAAPSGPGGWALMLAVLLARLPPPSAILGQATAWVARQRDPVLSQTIEQVLEAQLALLETRGTSHDEMLTGDLAIVGTELRRIVALLDGFAGETSPSTRRARVEAVRRRLDANCRARFADSLAEDLLAPLHAMCHQRSPDAMMRLEAAARHLRAFETEARRLGSAATYDALLCQTATAVQSIAGDAGLTLVDTVRLVEILAGPETALPLLA